jgi:hypothetical protein
VNRVDLHPEELLDKERRGALSHEERRRLDDHLRHCPACAIERRAERDFRAVMTAAEADDRAASRALMGALATLGIDTALDPTSANAPPNAPPTTEPRTPDLHGAAARPPSAAARSSASRASARGADRGGSARGLSSLGTPRGMIVGLTVGALLGVSGTYLAFTVLTRPKPPLPLVVSGPNATAREPSPTDGTGVSDAPSARDAVPSRASEDGAEATEPDFEIDQDPAFAVPRATPARGDRRLDKPPPVRETAAPEPAVPPRSAADIFAEANELRRRGEVTRALALYDELERVHPGSREAETARVSAGRLLLDRSGDHAAALARFEAYLTKSPRGELAEEARVGRALALQKLGRPSEERRAWQELLEAHPNSVHAARARARLDAIP